MNRDQRNYSGFITEFFSRGRAPAWNVVARGLAEFSISKLTGMEFLDDRFLRILFGTDPTMLKIIPDLSFSNHHLIQVFLKHEYNIDGCESCGHFTKKVSCNWTNPLLPQDVVDTVEELEAERAEGEADEVEEGEIVENENDVLSSNIVSELLEFHAKMTNLQDREDNHRSAKRFHPSVEDSHTPAKRLHSSTSQ